MKTRTAPHLLIMLIFGLFSILFLSTSAFPIPMGIAGTVVGEGAAGANVFMMIFAAGTDLRLASFNTLTDQQGRFVGAVSTDSQGQFDVYIKLICQGSGSQVETTILNVAVGTDLFFNLTCPDSNPPDQSQSGGGSGGGGSGKITLPPIINSPNSEKETLPLLKEGPLSKTENKTENSFHEKNDLNENSPDQESEPFSLEGELQQPAQFLFTKYSSLIIIATVFTLLVLILIIVHLTQKRSKLKP